MGLDMYLRASLDMGGWEHSPEEERQKFYGVLTAAEIPRDVVTPDAPSATLNVTVAYWRKANAVHRWFVEKVQDGVDECQEAYVTREQLTALRDDCKRALAAANISDGQPVDYDEWYIRDLEDTVKQLDAVLGAEALKRCDFYYQSSW